MLPKSNKIPLLNASKKQQNSTFRRFRSGFSNASKNQQKTTLLAFKLPILDAFKNKKNFVFKRFPKNQQKPNINHLKNHIINAFKLPTLIPFQKSTKPNINRPPKTKKSQGSCFLNLAPFCFARK
jgi:hypothetical protein